MILVITRDTFLFKGIQYLMPDEEIKRIDEGTKISLKRNDNLMIIIDSLYNNIIHSDFIKRLTFLNPKQVVILSAFDVRMLFTGINTAAISRNVDLLDFINVVRQRDYGQNRLIEISSREHFVLTLIANGMSKPMIANKMNISIKTVHSYVQQIKKIMRISRIYEICLKSEFKYLVDGGSKIAI